MRAWSRKWWPVGKALLAVAIVVAVGRQFARDLHRPELWQRSFRLQWLLLSALLYIMGLGLSAAFWQRLLRELGQRPRLTDVVRAYYLGHLGKYLPGKAWALFMRATSIHGRGVRLGVAILSSTYEVLTTMAAGVLLSAMLFAFLTPQDSLVLDWRSVRNLLTFRGPESAARDRTVLVVSSLVLLAVTGLPILPPIFNRLVHHLASLKSLAARQAADVSPLALPRVRFVSLLEGLALTGCGWLFLGASLWAALQGILLAPPPWTWEGLGRYSAMTALAYVAGFAIVVVPGGLGVREFFLTFLLAAELEPIISPAHGDARGLAVLTVLVLRLVWTAGELVVASAVYWFPGPGTMKIE